MKSEVGYIALFLVSVLISSVAQIILKKSADRQHDSKIREYLNVSVIIAYIFFFGSTLITVVAYRSVPLSLGPVLEATGYIWVSILGILFLKERISRKKLWGLMLIVLGILVFNLL